MVQAVTGRRHQGAETVRRQAERICKRDNSQREAQTKHQRTGRDEQQDQGDNENGIWIPG